MAKVIHQYKGNLLDSQEEVWMAMWLHELLKAGYVNGWNKIQLPIRIFESVDYMYVRTTELKTKTKREIKKFTLLQDLDYTPDFQVTWSPKGMQHFVSRIGDNLNPKSWFFCDNIFNTTLIEVKPNFDQNGKTAKFSIIQKILWNTQEKFVDLIQPEKLFEDTFMPVEAMLDFRYKKTPTGKNKGKKFVGDWKTDYVPKTLEEYVKGK